MGPLVPRSATTLPGARLWCQAPSLIAPGGLGGGGSCSQTRPGEGGLRSAACKRQSQVQPASRLGKSAFLTLPTWVRTHP